MKKTRNQKIIICVLVGILLILLFDLGPFGGSVRFYSTWIDCGNKPVKLLAKPGLLWYEETAPFELTRPGYTEYKCTPLEAEKAGHSANSEKWEMPHLRKLQD